MNLIFLECFMQCKFSQTCTFMSTWGHLKNCLSSSHCCLRDYISSISDAWGKPPVTDYQLLHEMQKEHHRTFCVVYLDNHSVMLVALWMSLYNLGSLVHAKGHDNKVCKTPLMCTNQAEQNKEHVIWVFMCWPKRMVMISQGGGKTWGEGGSGSWDSSPPASHPAPPLSVGKEFGSRSRGSNHQQLAHYNRDALMDCTGVHPAYRMEKMEKKSEKKLQFNMGCEWITLRQREFALL